MSRFGLGRSMPKQTHVIIFTRYPVTGRCKTRLIPALGAEGAARLQRRMTERVCDAALSTGDDVTVRVCYTGASRRCFQAWLGDAPVYDRQVRGDLGCRMHRAFENAFSAGAGSVIAVGSDVPELTADLIKSAVVQLEQNDGVIGPAADGGYYLIGMKKLHPELFTGCDWGADTVLNQTRTVMCRLGLKVAELPVLNDVDRPADLDRIHRSSEYADLCGDLRLSIIIPTLNEAAVLPATLTAVSGCPGVEVVVADGGSSDDTCRIASDAGAKVLQVDGGRSGQLNAGAAASSGDILLFLHADTILPNAYEDVVRQTLDDPGTVAGAFSFRTDSERFRMRLVELGTNIRSRILQMPYGDQGLFLTRRIFDQSGGFPGMPLMEDFEFVRSLRRRGRIATVPEVAVTSGRRWQDLGVLRTLLINQMVIAAYLAGKSPEHLAAYYRTKK